MSVIREDRRAHRAAKREARSGAGPTVAGVEPGVNPGATAKFGLFGEVLTVGLLMTIIALGVGPVWTAGAAALQSGNKTHAGNLAAVIEKVRLPAAFATWLVEGEAVAFGMSVAERGMAEIGLICVHPDHRGHGYGRRIVQGLMGWAGAMGCHSAYLQVEQSNAVAISLYGSLGFRTLYQYETRILD